MTDAAKGITVVLATILFIVWVIGGDVLHRRARTFAFDSASAEFKSKGYYKIYQHVAFERLGIFDCPDRSIWHYTFVLEKKDGTTDGYYVCTSGFSKWASK